jgi:hypothetical protein
MFPTVKKSPSCRLADIVPSSNARALKFPPVSKRNFQGARFLFLDQNSDTDLVGLACNCRLSCYYPVLLFLLSITESWSSYSTLNRLASMQTRGLPCSTLQQPRGILT